MLPCLCTDQCGVVHQHQNRQLVGSNRAEDHMSRCAIQDVYELHQHSQAPAMDCQPMEQVGRLLIPTITTSRALSPSVAPSSPQSPLAGLSLSLWPPHPHNHHQQDSLSLSLWPLIPTITTNGPLCVPTITTS